MEQQGPAEETPQERERRRPSTQAAGASRGPAEKPAPTWPDPPTAPPPGTEANPAAAASAKGPPTSGDWAGGFRSSFDFAPKWKRPPSWQPCEGSPRLGRSQSTHGSTPNANNSNKPPPFSPPGAGPGATSGNLNGERTSENDSGARWGGGPCSPRDRFQQPTRAPDSPDSPGSRQTSGTGTQRSSGSEEAFPEPEPDAEAPPEDGPGGGDLHYSLMRGSRVLFCSYHYTAVFLRLLAQAPINSISSVCKHWQGGGYLEREKEVGLGEV